MQKEFAYDEFMMDEDKEDIEIGTFLAGDEEEEDPEKETDDEKEEEEGEEEEGI